MEQLVITIMQLAYLVQTRTPYCVFINFSGHVNSLDIRICKSKGEWQIELLRSETTTEAIRLMRQGDPNASLNAKIKILKGILDTLEIPYEECEVEEIYSQEYSF